MKYGVAAYSVSVSNPTLSKTRFMELMYGLYTTRHFKEDKMLKIDLWKDVSP